MSVGSNTRFLKIGMIKNFEFPLPDIKNQHVIFYRLLDEIEYPEE